MEPWRWSARPDQIYRVNQCFFCVDDLIRNSIWKAFSVHVDVVILKLWRWSPSADQTWGQSITKKAPLLPFGATTTYTHTSQAPNKYKGKCDYIYKYKGEYKVIFKEKKWEKKHICYQEGTKTKPRPFGAKHPAVLSVTKLWGGGDQSVFETITTSLLVTWHSFGRSYWDFLCRHRLAKCLIKTVRSLYYLISKSIQGNLYFGLSKSIKMMMILTIYIQAKEKSYNCLWKVLRSFFSLFSQKIFYGRYSKGVSLIIHVLYFI